MRILPWSKAYFTLAAVSVRLPTVIITGGVGDPAFFHCLGRLQPVLAQQVIAVDHQVRQRLLLLGLAVQVVLDFGVVVDVVQPRLVVRSQLPVVADDDPRGLDQTRPRWRRSARSR